MRRVPIAKAAAGQILAEKLTRHDGVLLASQGSPITDGLLRMLERLNIDTVAIEEEESRTEAEVLAGFREFEADLEARFRRIDPQSVLQALKKTMLFLASRQRDEALALINNPPSADGPAPAAAETDGGMEAATDG